MCSGGNSDHEADSDKDCAGVCFVADELLVCGECSGGIRYVLDTTDQDCAGVCFGVAALDDCSVCSGAKTKKHQNIPTNAYVLIYVVAE